MFESREEVIDYDNRFVENSFISNFNTELNQSILKKLWGFFLKDSDFPLSYERYDELINSDFCDSNLIFVQFQQFCPHNYLITSNKKNTYDIKLPMVGKSIHNINRNISYLDIFETINNDYYKYNVFRPCNCCCQTIKELIYMGNNIYDVRFNEETDYYFYKQHYYTQLTCIIQGEDPLKKEYDFSNMMDAINDIAPFKFDSEAKYCFT